ncbi:MATE family efflux transporter, partial [Bacillus sp. LR--39]
AAFFTAVPAFGNHGLWLAFLLFSLGRSVFLCMAVPGLTTRLFGERSAAREAGQRPKSLKHPG